MRMRQLVGKFVKVCDMRRLRLNESESKVYKDGRWYDDEGSLGWRVP